jgi:Ca2+-binding RTX toxin-like protein
MLDPSHFAATMDGLATAATAQFVYDTTNNSLSFDPDGTGNVAAVQIAALGNAPLLATTDIHLV